MHGFKSAILAKMILLKYYENGNKIFFPVMTHGPPNPGFRQEKVQTEDFTADLSRDLVLDEIDDVIRVDVFNFLGLIIWVNR